MIKIAIAEDNLLSLQVLEEKLSLFPEINIIHIAQNGAELLEKLNHDSSIDVILMDIEMPIMNGIEATDQIKKLYPSIKIIMNTIYDDDDYIFKAILAGADSYILKETKAQKVFDSIEDTLQGGAVMSPSIALKTLQILKKSPLPSKIEQQEKVILTDREIDILNEISQGFSNKMIAEHLYISPFTVKRHIENIYQKLQAHNRIELLDKAKRSGWL